MRSHTFDTQHESARPISRPRHLIMVQLGLIAVATLLCAAAPVRSVHRGEVVTSPQVDWIVKAEDSVCGLSQSRQLRKPAKVRFDDLLALTPEKKKLDRERIDPNSAKGLRLMNDARNRVPVAIEIGKLP